MPSVSLAARVAAVSLVAAAALPAQQDRVRPAPAPRPDRDAVIWRGPDDGGGFRLFGAEAGSRAVLGISTSSGGERDTLGLLITGITNDGPADRAGLEEGDRIAAVNGVNLRLSAADAGEPDMQGLVTRRLTRELAKVKPGAEVELRVWQNGQYKTVRARPVAADSLPGRRVLVAGASREARDRDREARLRQREERAVLGLDLQPTGSRRDTLGVLITRVAEGGPAERAGLVEGDRVAAVNGVDLRVSRDDAGDPWVSNAKSSRFSREMQDARVGQAVELRVYSNGQYRTVRVTPARAGDVYKEGRGGNVFLRSAYRDGDGVMPPAPPMPPMPAMPPMPPMPPAPPMGPLGEIEVTMPSFDVRIDREAIQRRVDAAMRRADDAMRRSLEGVRELRVTVPGGVYRM